jgi:hypothetical protein
MVENNNTKVFRCDKCDKNYKDKTGLWYHNNKYHKQQCHQNVPKCNKNSTDNHQNVTKCDKISTNNHEINIFECKYCKKNFSNRQSRWRHEQKCNNSNNNEIVELKKENAEIKNILAELLKSSKIHPKTLQKINKNLINGNNNTINSGTVNNTIQIVKFGSEDIKSILSTKEIKNILNCRYKAIEESIKKVHFNDDRPEYRNIYITNLRDNIAYVYNGNKFEAVQKYSIINQLIDQHMNNIEVSLEDYKDRLPERTVEILDKLIEKLQDDHTSMIDEENNKEFKNYRLFKINEVKLMIYNETGNNTEVIKLKYNNSIFSKPLKEIEV